MAGFLAWKCPSTAYGYAIYCNTIHGAAQIEDVCSWFFQIKFVPEHIQHLTQYKYCFFLYVDFWIHVVRNYFFSNFKLSVFIARLISTAIKLWVYYGLMTTVLSFKIVYS